MKTQQIKTVHPEIGYTNNLEVVECALREQLGIDDASWVLKAVAAYVWSVIAGQVGEEKYWTSDLVLEAIASCENRLHRMLDLTNKSIRAKGKS